MASPAKGAPTAEPTVIDEPCQPIASPRPTSGTSLETWSTVAVMVGAQNSPEITSSTVSATPPVAKAIGRVSSPRPPSSTNGEIGRCRPP